MKQITIYPNPLDKQECEILEGDDLWLALMDHFGDRLPEGARIYHEVEATDHDVTPLDVQDAWAVAKLPGPFIVRLGAQGLETGTIALIIAAVSAVASAAMALLMRPSIPKQGNVQSSNNQLSDRSNQARPLKRVEDIFGQVCSTPSLIQQPYRIFQQEGNVSQEYEIAYMCVGRGSYAVAETSVGSGIYEVRDGETLVSDISGESVEVYAPLTSPNSGDSPQLRIGTAINKRVVNVAKSNSVDGATLYPPNYQTLTSSDANAYFRLDTHLYSIDPGVVNFKRYFEVGSYLRIQMDDYPDGSGTINLSGTYLIDGLDANHVTLHNPESVTTDWEKLADFSSERISFANFADYNFIVTSYFNTTTGNPTTKKVGSFIVGDSETTSIVVNLIAQGGLYKSGSGANDACPVTVRISTQCVDESGSPYGAITNADFVVPSSTTDTSQKAVTGTVSVSGRQSVSAVRVTPSDYAYSGTLVDEIKWRDLYAMSDVSETHFGDVTTVQSLTKVTAQSVGVKQRKLNLLVTRKVKTLNSDGTINTTLTASRDAKDIFVHVALDDRIGRQTLAQIDGKQIYDEIAEVKTYFGTSEAAEFCYTFDDDNTSGEDIMRAVANAAFCEPIRRDGKLQLIFERETDSGSMLFGHRNTIPGSQQRTDRFGPVYDNDGIEYNYPDASKYDAPTTYRVPTDGSAKRPKKIDAVGPRNFYQVFWHAWREYYKCQYQNCTTEFSALEQGAIVAPTERILVADNTDPACLDGNVVDVDGLVLTLSQPVTFESGKNYNIFLQHKDATTQVIAIDRGETKPAYAGHTVTLQSAPSQALVTDPDAVQQTVYMIAEDGDASATAFRLHSKDVDDTSANTFKIGAYNDDARYYQKDHVTPA